MSQENLELALRAYDAFNRRDWDGFVALMDDDVEIVTRIAAIEGGRHGHEGMRRWWENMLTAFPDYDIEVVDVRDLGGRDVGVPARSRRGPTRSRLSKRLRRTARARPAYDCAVDVAAFIERYDRAWNEQDVDAIMAMHTPDMVFENHTRGVRAEGLPSASCSSRPSLINPTCGSGVVGATSVTTSW
jgi:hypothetical protein